MHSRRRRVGKSTTAADCVLERLQHFAEALARGEKITESFPSRQLVLDLKPLPYTPQGVQEIRRILGVSQAVLAQLLGTSVRTVQAWERGANKPSEMACRWLDEIKRNPDYWIERIKQAAVPKVRKRAAAEA
jgi:putative transcriptional regulator